MKNFEAKMVMVMMVVYVGIVISAMVWVSKSRGDEPIELPPEIRHCTTDADCEYQAWLLCESGDLEWCIKEA